MIKECERLGIVVDLSHANEATVTGAPKWQKTVFTFSYRPQGPPGGGQMQGFSRRREQELAGTKIRALLNDG